MLKDGRKLHFCCFCRAWRFRIPEHMKAKHYDNDRIKAILKLGKKDKIVAFKKIRHEGDMIANTNSLSSGSTYSVVVRKSKNESIGNYTPCYLCDGVFSNKTLSRHLKRCKLLNKEEDQIERKGMGLRTSKMLLHHTINSNSKYQDLKSNILTRMKQDELTNLIQNDEGLLLLGKNLYEKGGDSSFNEISCKLRRLARLVITFRNFTKTNASSLELVDSTNWDDVISSVKNLVNHQKQKVGIPSLLLDLGRSLASLAGAKRALAIRSNNSSMKEEAQNFLELHKDEWQIYTKHAMDTMKKDHKPEVLPLAADIEKLKNHVMKEIQLLVSKDEITTNEWSRLLATTVTRLITFNARRGSEPSKLTIEQWEKADSWKRKEDINNLTDPVEIALAKKLKVIYVSGKRKRRVPIIITPEVTEAVGKLLQFRKVVGVDERNIYLFPRHSRGSLNHVRGWEVVHDTTKRANLQQPNLMTSTKIRKHLATVLQLMALDSAELHWVTDHLGHSEQVHKEWYRQEPSTVELTKVARVLLAKDEGQNLRNKKVSDLNGK